MGEGGGEGRRGTKAGKDRKAWFEKHNKDFPRTEEGRNKKRINQTKASQMSHFGKRRESILLRAEQIGGLHAASAIPAEKGGTCFKPAKVDDTRHICMRIASKRPKRTENVYGFCLNDV